MDGYNYFVNDNYDSTVKGDPNEEEYQVLPYYPEIADTIANSDAGKAAKYYDQYIGAEVLRTNHKGEKLMGKVSNIIK